MKKLSVLFLIALLLVALVACGGSEEEKSDNKDAQKQSTSGSKEEAPELFDAGNVTAPVPAGWKAFTQTDYSSDDPNAIDPDIVQICKGGETQTDIFIKPYIQINYWGPDGATTDFEYLKSIYEQVELLEPMQIGPYLWEGFSTTDYGTTNIILYTQNGEYQLQASISCGEGNDAISVEDADVQQILAGVTPSK